MSWLIVGISAFQHTSRLVKCPRRPGNKRDPLPTWGERARHDSGESRCVKPLSRGQASRAPARCFPGRLAAILPRPNARKGSSRLKSRLTLLDCLGIGVNGIIGSGIFLLPARVFAAAGGLAWASDRKSVV